MLEQDNLCKVLGPASYTWGPDMVHESWRVLAVQSSCGQLRPPHLTAGEEKNLPLSLWFSGSTSDHLFTLPLSVPKEMEHPAIQQPPPQVPAFSGCRQHIQGQLGSLCLCTNWTLGVAGPWTAGHLVQMRKNRSEGFWKAPFVSPSLSLPGTSYAFPSSSHT